MHQISTNHRLVLIYMNSPNVSNVLWSMWYGFYHRHIVGGKRVNSGVLSLKNNSLNAVINPIFPLRRLFGAHHFPSSWLRLLCFVLFVVNVDNVSECNRYIIYIKIVYRNNCRYKIIWSYNCFADVWLIGNNLMTVFNE